MNEHRQDEGTMVLILGIVSAVFALVGPAAVYLGSRAMEHLPEGSQQYNYARTGWIIGWITSVYTALFALLFAGYLGVIVLVAVLG